MPGETPSPTATTRPTPSTPRTLRFDIRPPYGAAPYPEVGLL